MAGLTLSPKIMRALDFGAPAAERDMGRGLEKYFVESAAFQRVRSGAKTIILGNRGSGKSAIFKVLASRERSAGSHVIELAPEDYSYELLSSTMAAANAGSWAKHGAYAAAWKYLIYVLIMKEVSGTGGKGATKAIYKYVRDNHPGPETGALSVLVSYLKRLEGIKIGPLEAGFKSRELDKLYKLEEIHHLLPQLKEILDRRRVVVLVDELDRGWDSSTWMAEEADTASKRGLPLLYWNPDRVVVKAMVPYLREALPPALDEALAFLLHRGAG